MSGLGEDNAERKCHQNKIWHGKNNIYVLFIMCENTIRAATCDFQQCGKYDQQRIRPACAFAQFDWNLC